MTENGVRSGPTAADKYSNGHNEELGPENCRVRLNEVIQRYIQDLRSERSRMENQYPLAVKLIDEALERVQSSGRITTREHYADVYQQRTIKLSQKVHIPIKDKKFNYVGKLLGPKGNSLRRLQEETQCKIVILGRFSMKDRVREEELRSSADTKYAHLNLPLHVEVSTIAPPAEAYARIAYALAEIRRYLIPDKHDDIRQKQFRELMEDPESAKKIAIRQQQHQLAVANEPSACHSNQRGVVNSNFRSRYQNYYNDETIYYRSINNTYHNTKAYIQAVPRPNANQTLSSSAIVTASTTGMVANATLNGRSHNTSGGTSNAVGMRYRPIPYQFVKK